MKRTIRRLGYGIKRLNAYSALSRDLISFGLHRNSVENIFGIFATASEAILLTENDELISRIDQFIVKMDRMKSLSEKGNEHHEEASKIYDSLSCEARSIIKELRDTIIQTH